MRHDGGHRTGADGTGGLDGRAGQLEGSGCFGRQLVLHRLHISDGAVVTVPLHLTLNLITK